MDCSEVRVLITRGDKRMLGNILAATLLGMFIILFVIAFGLSAFIAILMLGYYIFPLLFVFFIVGWLVIEVTEVE